jgi:hypothetical protein
MTTSTARDNARTPPPPTAPCAPAVPRAHRGHHYQASPPPEGEDTIEDGEDIGISTEDQLKLRALRIKNNHCKSKKRYSKPSANESPCKPKCVR